MFHDESNYIDSQFMNFTWLFLCTECTRTNWPVWKSNFNNWKMVHILSTIENWKDLMLVTKKG